MTIRNDTNNEVTYSSFNSGYCFKFSLDTFDISLLSRIYLKIKKIAMKYVNIVKNAISGNLKHT